MLVWSYFSSPFKNLSTSLKILAESLVKSLVSSVTQLLSDFTQSQILELGRVTQQANKELTFGCCTVT